MGSKDNKAEKTREVADIRIYHFGWNFSKKKDVMNYKAMVLAMASKFFHIYDMSDNIEYICNGGQPHCGRQAQHGEED